MDFTKITFFPTLNFNLCKMSFMRPRKTLQLRFDKQFQPSDEISLKRGANGSFYVNMKSLEDGVKS